MTNGARIPVVELVGATWVLAAAHGLRSKALAEALEMVLDHRDLVLLGSDAVRAAPERFRRKPTLGFCNCLMVQLAHQARHLRLGFRREACQKVEGTQKG